MCCLPELGLTQSFSLSVSQAPQRSLSLSSPGLTSSRRGNSSWSVTPISNHLDPAPGCVLALCPCVSSSFDLSLATYDLNVYLPTYPNLLINLSYEKRLFWS